MKKFNQLLDNDFKIVEKKWKVFILPLVIIFIALIMGFVFMGTKGNFFNIGMDFTGGYKINLTFGATLTDDNFDDYLNRATEIAEGLTDEDGKAYGIKILDHQTQGEGNSRGFVLKFRSVADEDTMDDISQKLADKLNSSIFFVTPTYNVSGATITATYPRALVGNDAALLKASLEEKGLNVTAVEAVTTNNRELKVTFASALTDTQLSDAKEALVMPDVYSGFAAKGAQVGGTISGENLAKAMLAIVIAILAMLVYIFIRFEFLSSIAAVLALMHDVLMMLCFMVIFHIEIGSTFIAAVITILGYSINNTIVIFDRVRENSKIYQNKRINGKTVKPEFLANQSVKETVWRSINTTITTLIMIVMVAIIGVPDIRIFALPIIIGLLFGTYSSICISPTNWAMLKRAFPGVERTSKSKPEKKKTMKDREKLEV